jgi:cadmium resistance protein CadD (predicted permease)
MWGNIVVVALASLLLLAMVRGRLRSRSLAKYDEPALAAIIKEAEREMAVLARQHFPDAWVFSLGAGPLYLAIWVATKTDAERDALRANKQLRREFRSALRTVGYPRAAISSVGFSFESQETVDRDHRGNWYLALK